MNKNTVKLEFRGNVGIVSLNNGITNALNKNFILEIHENLKNIREDQNVRGVVLTSSNEKFFVIGFNIPELINLSEAEFKDFYSSFNRLCLEIYTFPKPIIAALSGHATAGGCIIGLCCDYRFIAEGRKLMGLNEIKLGVPIPYVGDCILRELVGYKNARDITDSGNFYPPEKLLELGMVDEIIPIQDLLTKSIEKAEILGSSYEAYSVIKRNRVEIVESQILKTLHKKEEIFMKLWYSPKCRELLIEAAKKF